MSDHLYSNILHNVLHLGEQVLGHQYNLPLLLDHQGRTPGTVPGAVELHISEGLCLLIIGTGLVKPLILCTLPAPAVANIGNWDFRQYIIL